MMATLFAFISLAMKAPMAGPCWSSRATVRNTVLRPRSVTAGLVAEPEIIGMPALAYISDAGMVTPELRWPMTAATLASTSFWATLVPTFGSAWSSSLIILKVTGLPSMVIFFAFASATARATPFSSSLPRWAIEPVSGPAWAMVMVGPAGAAGAAAAFLGSSFWPQAV